VVPHGPTLESNALEWAEEDQRQEPHRRSGFALKYAVNLIDDGLVGPPSWSRPEPTG